MILKKLKAKYLYCSIIFISILSCFQNKIQQMHNNKYGDKVKIILNKSLPKPITDIIVDDYAALLTSELSNMNKSTNYNIDIILKNKDLLNLNFEGLKICFNQKTKIKKIKDKCFKDTLIFGNLFGFTFENTNFENAIFSLLFDLKYTIFYNCNFKNAIIKSYAKNDESIDCNVKFILCNFENAVFTNLNFIQSILIPKESNKAKFNNCKFEDCLLSNKKLFDENSDYHMKYDKFYQNKKDEKVIVADLCNSKFNNCKFENTCFQFINTIDIEFKECIFEEDTFINSVGYSKKSFSYKYLYPLSLSTYPIQKKYNITHKKLCIGITITFIFAIFFGIASYFFTFPIIIKPLLNSYKSQ